jgi:capsular polysaccharide export protein
VPVIALGTAIYDMPGLTEQRALDEFWGAPTPPDRDLYDALRRVLAARCLIPGGFFTEAGLALATEAALARVEVGLPRPARPARAAATADFAGADALIAATSTR